MSANTGGAAFPRPGSNWSDGNGSGVFASSQPGMTLRDYFAAKAMAVLLQHALETELGADGYDSFDAMIAEDAYAQADAMLAARSTEAK